MLGDFLGSDIVDSDVSVAGDAVEGDAAVEEDAEEEAVEEEEKEDEGDASTLASGGIIFEGSLSFSRDLFKTANAATTAAFAAIVVICSGVILPPFIFFCLRRCLRIRL